MKLWTIQPLVVYNQIMNGTYKLDKSKSNFYDMWGESYEWLAEQMEKHNKGNRNEDIIWAWHTFTNKHRKPDVRTLRKYYDKDSEMVCITLEIPDDRVLLIDSDGWNARTTNGFNFEDEDYEEWENWFYSLSKVEQKNELEKSWLKMFDVNVNSTIAIQAVFFGIDKRYIKKVQHFQGVRI